MQKYLFLTGATGLLGRYLVRDLLVRGRHLALLARGSHHETAQQRIESIISYWETELNRPLPRPVVLEGDICQAGLGLSASDQKWVEQHCDEVVHSAASLTFHADGSGEPWNSNFGGTENVLQLMRKARLTRLHYVSTAYVCGLREGRIMESDLDHGQTFRNDYEQSKLPAEKLVRQADFLDSLTVYRPAVIAGDSVTGYTSAYHGIYLYLRLMALLVPRQPLGPDGKRQTPCRVRLHGDETRNVITVDWVSAIMTHLIMTPSAHGKTFHMAPAQPLTAKELINAGYTFFNSSGIEWVGDREIDPATYNAFEAEIIPAMNMYENYQRTDPVFDCTNLLEHAGHIPCPAITEKVIHRFIEFGQQDRWGKRRQRAVQADCSMYENLRLIAVDSETFSRDYRPLVGLDILGPGGGQWTLGVNAAGKLASNLGLDFATPSLIRLAMDDFKNLIQALHNSGAFEAGNKHVSSGANGLLEAACIPSLAFLAK